MPVFQISRNIKGNSFRGHNLSLFYKSCIFPSIYDINPLWEKYNLLQNHSKSANENCSLLCFWKTEKLAFYSTLSSNFSFMIKVPDYKVHGNKKICLKGSQNTPNFYLKASRCVIDSFSNLRCFVKNVKFLP